MSEELNTTPAIVKPPKTDCERLVEYLEQLKDSMTVSFYGLEAGKKMDRYYANQCLQQINCFLVDHEEYVEGLRRLKQMIKAELLEGK